MAPFRAGGDVVVRLAHAGEFRLEHPPLVLPVLRFPRPELLGDSLLTDARRRRLDAVVCWRLDRLGGTSGT
jgi:hypothetical protein